MGTLFEVCDKGKGWHMKNMAEMFLEMLVAAMKDAVNEDHITQLKAQCDDKNGKLQHCRIIVIPEKLKVEWPQGLGNK